MGFGCPTNFLEPRFTLAFTTDQRSEIGRELANNTGSGFTEHRMVGCNLFVFELGTTEYGMVGCRKSRISLRGLGTSCARGLQNTVSPNTPPH